MASRSRIDSAAVTLAEMREFSEFAPASQRYIRRSLDIGLGRRDAFLYWARNKTETRSIRSQYLHYQELPTLRRIVPIDSGLTAMEEFTAKLTRITAYDLAQGRLESFSAYRFLYERLLGAAVRPWLPSAFCGAAALPQIDPAWRRRLLQSISEAAATAPGWSDRAPIFYPEWVDLADTETPAH